MQGDASWPDGRTWLVLQRDLSVWLRQVEAATFTTMVLDLTDRGTRAVEAGSTIEESLRDALSRAAKEPARGMQGAVPDRIQVPNGLVPALESVLESLQDDAGFRPDTVVEEVTPEEGAEWVFDDFITQIVGRQPAEERLFPEDATLLYEQARRFMEAAPWQQWTSDDALLIDLKVGSERLEGIATIIGHGSTQPGILLTPGRERAGTLMESGTGPPPGTLLTQLEGTEGHPDLFLRARRYGWPADAALTPSFISMQESGFRELDRRESWPMALALAGVVKHFEGGGRADTWGNLDLPTGRRGRYHVRKAPEMESPPRRGDLIGIKITQDLLSDGSEIQIGVMPPDSLSTFRHEADVVVRSDAVFPAGIRSVPVITITPSNRAFAGVVDRLKRARPLGVTVINRPEGPLLTVMGQRAGYVIANDPAMSQVWERNLKESDGAHVLMVSDGVTNIEEPDPDRPGLGRPGHVYGLFECVLRGGMT
ncbi:MAG TPA: hypothetical protein VHK65_09415 [Candidatus Dormibacteraeota bacterium]|nr:hypothetical protein [Candidatus Dormibacteraeota bacterium]